MAQRVARPPQYLDMDFPDYVYRHLPCYGHKYEGEGKKRTITESLLCKTPEEVKEAEELGFEFPEDQTEPEAPAPGL